VESKPKLLKALMLAMMPIECFASVASVACPVFMLVVVVFNILLPCLVGNFSGLLQPLLLGLILLVMSGLLLIKGFALSWLQSEQCLPRWTQPVLAFTLSGLLLVQAFFQMYSTAAEGRGVPVMTLECSASLAITGILFIKRVPQRLLGAGHNQ
jgi:hypothetical protein